MADDTKKTNPFNIPAQFADFVSIEANNEIVVLQFAQSPANSEYDTHPVAKIAIPRSLALALGDALHEREKSAADETDGGDSSDIGVQ